MKFIVKWSIPQGFYFGGRAAVHENRCATAGRRDDDRAMAWHERRRSVDRRDQ